jgi:hypothetical protein
MHIIRAVFSMTLHCTVSDDYNPLCQHTFQGYIYMYVCTHTHKHTQKKDIIYMCHKKRGHLPFSDHKNEDISAKKGSYKGDA